MFRNVVLILGLAIGLPAIAQNSAWVQIEAHPTLSQAEDRARAYAPRLENVNGFRLSSGWYAIALGPYAPPIAEGELARLRGDRLIPNDSFLADGDAFRDQFWPLGVQSGIRSPIAAPTEQATETAAALPLTPADESPAEARAAERYLTRSEREEVQSALLATGFYDSRIDGAFGPGTRRAMGSWQAAFGHDATGILTTKQRLELVEGYRAVVASLGLAPVFDAEAGIEIVLPMAAVRFSGYDAPFAQYKGEKAEAFLISQSGDADTLRGLYDVLQTLEIVPLEGPREFGRGRFAITGANDTIDTHIEAVLTTDGVKGFALIWPAGESLNRRLALEAMRASFSPVSGIVLPDTAGNQDVQRPDLLAGLQIRQPSISVSGFYVGSDGTVLTSAESVGSCAKITLDGDVDVTLSAVDSDLGLALLKPEGRLVPIGVGRLKAETPRLQSEIAVTGYSYGGVLGAPTISFGTLADVRGLNGEDALARLALSAQPGDAGGPVLDSGGAILGMLLPKGGQDDRSLPDDVHFATDAGAIAAFLSEHGIALTNAKPADSLPPEDLAMIGADMTVLVECWN